jgi:hypothetical protein
MIPTQVPEPFHRDGWVYEEKVDGWRIWAYKTAPAFVWSAERGSSTPSGSMTSPRR